MTLCVAWIREVDNREQLVIATDSLISGGFRYPYGTKLMLLSRGDCAICWEGDAIFTYSFTENAKIDVEFSDRLHREDVALVAVQRRLTKVFQQLWEGNLNDPNSVYHDAQFSFLFGGYCPRYKEAVAWHIQQDDSGQQFTSHPRRLTGPCLIGSGKQAAKDIMTKESDISPYQLLTKAIEDPLIEDVGGVPQLVTIDETGVEVIGVEKEGARYLFGRPLNSTGHKTRVRFVPYRNDEF